ncbi:Ger(x)C family spore germination protein [Paenibacillus sp.]|uniref:Ger(x)C family spore germination protein n=1 Tax=Paenibacillus sp. TaxID=58172 RepID=UPI00281126AE|nr:Ger(x)C family spore germination protein [Paenibacillus sp.]
MKLGKTLLLLAGIVLITGCWDQVEMDELAVVNATAFDQSEEGRWLLTYQIIIPRVVGMRTGGSGSGTPVMAFSTGGDTIGEAVGNARKELPRVLFFPHSQVVVISRRAAERGIGEIVDFYLRDEESRETSNVLIYDGDTRKILEVLTNLERLPGNAVHQLVEGAGKGDSIVPSKMHELVTTLMGPTGTAVIPEIHVSGNLEKQTGSQAIQKTRRAAVLKMNRAAVLKNGRFVGWLAKSELIGLGFATDRIRNVEIAFPCDTRGGRLATFSVKRSHTEIRPNASDGRLKVQVKVDASGVIAETACRTGLDDPKGLARMEEQIERRIVADVRRTFDASKKLNTDVLGFGGSFRRSYPRLWKELSANWDASFSEIQLQVEANVKIRNTGMIGDPVTKLLQERE